MPYISQVDVTEMRFLFIHGALVLLYFIHDVFISYSCYKGCCLATKRIFNLGFGPVFLC